MAIARCRPLALALTAILAPDCPAQDAGGDTPPLVAQFEDALVGVIERCERSVVSVTRVDESLDALAAGDQRAGARAAVRGPGGQPVFFPPQVALPGRLGQLQSLTPALGPASGAGVVIDSEAGLILTQYRVVKYGESHLVTDVDGERYKAWIRGADPRSGLAVLKIVARFPATPGEAADEPIRLPALPIGEAERLRKGRFVVAIGNPFSIEADGQPTASWGSITNTAAKAPDDENLNDTPNTQDGTYRTTLHHFGSLIQTDARLGWNASGGAVVNLAGELVGITTTAAAIAGHESPAGYAIPLNQAMRRAVDAMRRGLEPEYGLLGVQFTNAGATRSEATGQIGIAVGDAFRGGPARRAGLRKNDLLLEIDGQPIRTPEALQLVVGSLPPGEPTPVVYERGGRRLETRVTLGKAYIEPDRIVVSRRRYPEWRGLRVDYATAIPPKVLQVKAGDGSLAEEGCVVVTEVDQNSVSWKSGVRPYDFISHVGGERVTSPDEFYAAVGDADVNVKLKFTKPLTAGDAALN